MGIWQTRYRLIALKFFDASGSRLLKPLSEIDGIRGIEANSNELFSLIRHLTRLDSQSEDVIRFFDESDNGITFYIDNNEIYDLRVEINESSRNSHMIEDVNSFALSRDLAIVNTDGDKVIIV